MHADVSFPRRTVLGLSALAGVGVAGCSAPSNRPTGRPAPPPADPQLADLRAERELLRRYDATIAAHPELASRLRPLRSDHAVHESALAKLVPHAAPSASTAPSGSPVSASAPRSGSASASAAHRSAAPASSSDTSRSAAPAVPSDPVAAVRSLRAAEQQAVRDRSRSCLAASAQRCGLLGSIAASEATHVDLLS